MHVQEDYREKLSLTSHITCSQDIFNDVKISFTYWNDNKQCQEEP